jgi:glycosyltransferase involved in cell wall biosynthesis
MLLGPSLGAVSGVSTHLNQIFTSSLSGEFRLWHFQVGSEGRQESRAGKLARLLLSPVQFAWQLALMRPAVVHINTSMDANGYWRDAAYLLVAALFRRRIVYQVHGGALPAEFFGGSRMLTGLLRMVLRLPDVVVLLARREFQAYRRFAPDLPLALVPNAIEIVADPVHKAVAPPDDRPLRIGFVGRLAESKGVFDVVQAVATLVARGIALEVTIAGSGPDDTRLRRRVADLGLEACVRFTGPVHGADRDRVWAESDLFAFPTHAEGLPYALLESMAARTPAVVTPVGAIPDVVQDGVHAVFIPVRDPAALARELERLHRDRALIARLGAAGRRRVEQAYGVERMAHDLRGLYLEPGGRAPCAVSRVS